LSWKPDATARSAEVKKSCYWAVLAAVLSWSQLASPAMAQGPAVQPTSGPRLALLDVSRIFKSHQRFKGMMEDMKADVERAEAQVKAERENITKLAERLQQFHKGTVEYNELERELAKRQADLAVQVQLQKNEFLQREAKIYHNVYQEIWQATDYFCKTNRIDMVLKYSGDAVDPDKPETVLAFINKPVVWYDRGLDITDQILGELNRTAINPGPANNRGPARPGVPFNK
jgi:Skp family chaperone for outer membrane proteins